MGVWRIPAWLALAGLAVLACANSRQGALAGTVEGRRRVMTLVLPRAPAPGEAATLRVAAGVLPRGARLVVRLSNGEILGAVTPYGVLPGRKAGLSMIPLPKTAIANGEVKLALEVLERGRKTGRAPTRDELGAVDILFVPVTGEGH